MSKYFTTVSVVKVRTRIHQPKVRRLRFTSQQLKKFLRFLRFSTRFFPILFDPSLSDAPPDSAVFTYEEVERCYPKIGRYRPIVLIGAPGVGRTELRKRLSATNPNHFKAPVPCESAHAHTRTHKGHTHAHTHTCTSACTHARVCALSVSLSFSLALCEQLRARTNVCTLARTHTYTHTHTHTHTHTCFLWCTCTSTHTIYFLMRTRTHKPPDAHTHTHTSEGAHTHTHTHTQCTQAHDPGARTHVLSPKFYSGGTLPLN